LVREQASIRGERRFLLGLISATLIVLAALFLGVPKILIAIILAIFVVVTAALFAVASMLHGRIDFILLSWVLFFPLGYYFLSFPRERSVLTLDRVVAGFCVVAIFFAGRGQRSLPTHMRTAGIWWTFFVVAAFTSLHGMENVLGASKEVLDAFVFPAILGFYIWRNFPVRQKLSQLHVLSSVMCLYVGMISLVELLRGEDLLPLPGAIFFSDDTGVVQRVNGTFATNNSLALIGLITLFLLIFLRRAVGRKMPTWQRGLHLAGLGAALTMALSPMFRSVVLTLVLIGILEMYWNRDARVRLTLLASALASVAGMLYLRSHAPGFFEARVSDLSDLYARIAQYGQTWALFTSHPINGVGLANYANVADNVPAAYYRGFESVGSAHNTLASILVDTGIIGFLGYFLAQVFFLQAFLQLRRRGTPEARLAYKFAVYVFLSYWITGLMLTSGYYSDLNLWYLFVTSVIYKYGCTEVEPEATRPLVPLWSCSPTGGLKDSSSVLYER